jgi:hypothetical protein
LCCCSSPPAGAAAVLLLLLSPAVLLLLLAAAVAVKCDVRFWLAVNQLKFKGYRVSDFLSQSCKQM